MEHLDLYVSGKTRVYFYAMNFEGKPLLLILIAFCFFGVLSYSFSETQPIPTKQTALTAIFSSHFTTGVFQGFSGLLQPWHCLHSQYFSYCPKA